MSSLIDRVSRGAHEMLRAYHAAKGDTVSPAWDETADDAPRLSDEQRAEMREMVAAVLANPEITFDGTAKHKIDRALVAAFVRHGVQLASER